MNRTSPSQQNLSKKSLRPRVIVRFEAMPPRAPSKDDTPFRLPRTLSPLLGVVTLAIVTGGCVGAFVGPVGIGVGALFGLFMGSVVGMFLSRETARSNSRTRDLDAIIGTTTGALGSSRATLQAHAQKVQREERESWGPDCLTPPPPLSYS